MADLIDTKNITWQQVVLCLGMLSATIAVYKLFGDMPAGVLLAISNITNFMMGRAASPKENTK